MESISFDLTTFAMSVVTTGSWSNWSQLISDARFWSVYAGSSVVIESVSVIPCFLLVTSEYHKCIRI